MMPNATASRPALRRTPLFQAHVDAGARMVPFAGWEMPVEYTGIRKEHLAVRSAVGAFDVSHMGQIVVTGSEAPEFVEAHLTCEIASMSEGSSRYGLICLPDGGILDDLIVYRLPDRFLLVVNAGRTEHDFRHLEASARRWTGVEIEDRSCDYAMIAVQGPDAVELFERLAGMAPPPRNNAVVARLAGIDVLAARTGYTGEDGVELMVDPGGASALWGALKAAGAVPVGLGARDTLRLEVCYPLYGNDLSVDRTPVEAGLMWCTDLGKEFVGSEAVGRRLREGPAERLVPFRLLGRGIPRPGCPVYAGDAERQVGLVTSGTYSPTLERGIGLAYIGSDRANPGVEIQIDIRGRHQVAQVAEKPLYNASRGPSSG